MPPTPAFPLGEATTPGRGDKNGANVSGVYNSDEPAEAWPLVGRGIPHVEGSVAGTEDGTGGLLRYSTCRQMTSREGRIRARSRAINQQQAEGLRFALGPVTRHQIVLVLIAEQDPGPLLRPCELSTEEIQDAGPEPDTYAEATTSRYANVWRKALSDGI